MDEEIKLISERLKGLRDVLEISVEEMAETYGCETEKYIAVENGEAEPSVSGLSKIAKKYGVSVDSICKLNNMTFKQASRIRVGQVLRIK